MGGKGILKIKLPMPHSAILEGRIRTLLDRKQVEYTAKPMMGGLCFMVDGKMCVGIEKERLMARIGPDAYDGALRRKGCGPMDFTGRQMTGFVFVRPEGYATESDWNIGWSWR